MATILLSVVFILGLIISGNYLIYDFLNLGYDRIEKILNENKELRTQIATLTDKFKQLKSDVEALNAQGDQFRMLVDLPRLSKDELQLGVGGNILNFDANKILYSGSSILDSINLMIDQLSREVNLQKESYNSVLNKYNYNQKLFASIPALKPMDGYYSPHGFGKRIHPVLGVYRVHEGLDIINDVGTPVYATGDGEVEFAGPSGGSYGIVVIINHGFGYQTLYAHLSKVLVRPGTKVKRGTMIAKSGKTGLVSGPHLHYEVIYNGVKKNPIDYFFDDFAINQYLKNYSNKNQNN
ncbi:MAG: metalloendopeptidase [Ignavibacteriae bacterium]|nr:MAG: metalloendopeptidase [Ignavibacteriota bacterium]